MAKKTRMGIVWAVKVGGDAGGNQRTILAKAIAEGLREQGVRLYRAEGAGDDERGISDQQLRALSAFLIDKLGMGNAGIQGVNKVCKKCKGRGVR